MVKIYEGDFRGEDLKIRIVYSRFKVWNYT